MPQVDITVGNDADFYQVFQYCLADGVTPINIAGTSFKMGVKRNLADAGAVFFVNSLPSAAGQIQIFDGPNGLFQIWIAKAQLQKVPTGQYFQSLIISLAANGAQPAIDQPLWSGSLIINPGASR
jgi:hypothetical protein